MHELTNRVMPVAKWLAVLLITLVLVAQPALGGTRKPVAKPGACCNKCSCCISPNSGGTAAPAVPNSTRVAFAKDSSFVPLISALLVPESRVAQAASFPLSIPGFPASVPIFVRHCTFLI